MKREEAKKYRVWRDAKFIKYKSENKCCYCIITILTAFWSFKFNKLFYSFFCNRKQFQADFTLAKYYRKLHTVY